MSAHNTRWSGGAQWRARLLPSVTGHHRDRSAPRQDPTHREEHCDLLPCELPQDLPVLFSILIWLELDVGMQADAGWPTCQKKTVLTGLCRHLPNVTRVQMTQPAKAVGLSRSTCSTHCLACKCTTPQRSHAPSSVPLRHCGHGNGHRFTCLRCSLVMASCCEWST